MEKQGFDLIYGSNTVASIISQYSEGKRLIVPGIKNIPDYAFTNLNLNAIEFLEGVNIFGNHVFENSTIQHITLPKTIKQIGTYFVYGCNKLGSVYYDGNLESWLSVSTINGWDYTSKMYHLACKNTIVDMPIKLPDANTIPEGGFID